MQLEELRQPWERECAAEAAPAEDKCASKHVGCCPTRWGSWLDAVDALAGQWEALHEVVRSEESLSALKKMLLEQMSDEVTRGIVMAIAKSTELVRHLIVVSQGSFSVVLCFC